MVKLSDSLIIKDMEIKNRIGFPPMMSGSADNGVPGERMHNVYVPIARGGTGMITVEATGATLANNPIQPNLGVAANVPAFKKLTDAVHKYDTKIGVQLADGGILTSMFVAMIGFPMPAKVPSKVDAATASSIYYLINPEHDKKLKEIGFEFQEMTLDDIEDVQNRFANSAKNAIDAGFDYVLIHSAHGTLFWDFLSPYFNQRTDKYGGSIENKCRFILETVAKMREKIGDKPIFARVDADEMLEEGGAKIDYAIKFAPILAKGGIDCLDISQGIQVRSPRGINVPTYVPHGGFVHYAEEIKKVVDVPVITVGRIIDLNMADDIIQQGKADIVYLGRQLICDPETPNKYFNGKPEDIKQCIGCLVSCGGVCVLSPYERHEYQELSKTESPKKIIILGAGIAGMETARVLKLRGHEVEIYEKSDKIGGLMPIVAAEYKKEDFMNIVKFHKSQIKKLNIPLHLNRELTKEEIKSLNPDVLVFAIGTKATVPVKFKDQNNVLTQEEAILKTKPMGKNVVLWGLDTYWRGGVETAITLRERGHNVMALAGKEKYLAGSITPYNYDRKLISPLTGRTTWIYRYMRDSKIPIFYQAKLNDVTDENIVLTDSEGKEVSIEADTLVYCGSRITRRKSLEQEFEGIAEIVFIGDCKQPRDIQAAMKDAHDFARNI